MFWSGEVGPVGGHGEENSGDTHRIFTEGNGKMFKEANGWNLATGIGQEDVEGGGEVDHKYIHQ